MPSVPFTLVGCGDRARMLAPEKSSWSLMQIQLNGAAFELAAAQTIASLLEQLQLGERRVAVELNLELVPRSLHASTQLNQGDVLEIVHAIGGG